MKKYDKSAMRLIGYREKELEESFEKMRDAIYGFHESFRPRLSDDDDRIIPEKLEEMLDQILSSYNEYLVNECASEGLDDRTEELYRKFLYCAITGPSVKSILPDISFYFSHIVEAKDYKDILELAKKSEHINRELQIEHEVLVYREEFPGYDIFDLMNEGVRIITGKGIAAFYNDEERPIYEELCKSLGYEEEYKEERSAADTGTDGETVTDTGKEEKSATETDGEESAGETAGAAEVKAEEILDISKWIDSPGIKVVEADPSEFDPMMEYQPSLSLEELQELLDNPDLPSHLRYQYEKDYELELNGGIYTPTLEEYEEEARRQEEQMDEEYEESLLAEQSWAAKLPDKDAFVTNYIDFRRLFYSIEHPDFSQTVRKMISIYLYENEISPISFDNGYGLIDKHINHAIRRIRFEAQRRRSLS